MFHAQNPYFIIISHHFGPILRFLLVFTVLFLISAGPFRNGSVFACSTACSSAAKGLEEWKWVNMESFRNWLEAAQHISTNYDYNDEWK